MKLQKSIVIKFKHIYMFWSVGIYEIEKLSEDYLISIIVDPSFKKDNKFLEYTIENKNINFFFVSDIKKYNILSHLSYKNTITKILEDLKPDILIQNDYIELENMYLFSIAKHSNQNIIKIVLSMSQASTEKTFNLIDEIRIGRLNFFLRSYKLSKLFLQIFKGCKLLTSIVHNYLLPKLIGLKNPYLKQSAYNNIDLIPLYIPFEHFFCYEDIEYKYMKNLFNISKNNFRSFNGFHKICSLNFDELIDNSQKNVDGILYLPSLIGCREINKQEIALIRRWLRLIESISSKEGLVNVGVKFHPSIINMGNNFELMKAEIKKEIPNAVFFDPNENVIELINLYSHILSDNSSVLLHARNFENKIIISKDFNDFPNSDAMQFYDGINYLGPDIHYLDIKNIIFKKTKKKPVFNTLKDNLNKLSNNTNNSYL